MTTTSPCRACRACQTRPATQTLYDRNAQPRRYCDECGDALRDHRSGVEAA